MLRAKLATKLSCAISALIALLFGLAGYLALERFRDEFRLGALRQQAVLVSALASQLDARLGGTRGALAALAGSITPELLADPARLRELLAARGDTQRNFPGGLFVLRPDGRLLAGVPSPSPLLARDHSFSDYLKVPLATGRPFVSAPFFHPSQRGEPSVICSVAIRDASGAVRGVLCGSSELMREDLLGSIARVRPGDAGYLSLCDTQGTIMVHPDQSRLLQRDRSGAEPPAGSAGSGRGWSREIPAGDGVALLASSRRLASVNWILTANLPLSEANRGLARGTRFFAAVLALCWGLSLPLVWLVCARFTAPLQRLLLGLRPGSPESAPQLPGIPSGDEFEALARAAGELQGELALARRESEFLQALLDAIPAPIFYKDAAGVYLGVNRAFESYRGVERSQLVGRSVFEIYPAELATVFFDADRELMDRGGEQRYESQMIHADGTLRDVIYYKALFGDRGTESGVIVGTLLDISERKRMEAALEEQNEFSENLVRNLAVPAFVLNDRHEVIIWNRACEELSGLPSREVIGTHRHWLAFNLQGHPTHADLVLDGDYRAADRHGPPGDRSALVPGGMHAEGWCRNQQGLDAYLMFSAAPISNRAGEVIAAIETVEDITGRKRTEDRLRTLSCAVEQSPTMVVITDTEGTIEYVNRKFVEVTGYSSAEAIGANPSLLKSGVTPDEVYRDLWSTVRGGAEWRGEFQNKKKGGELYYETATISPVQDESGVVSHFIALKEDITERRALANALRHAQKMESLGTLTGGVAHDFNNILTAIIGYANLIQMKSDAADPRARFAGQVVASAEKAAVLTRGLLAYSKNQPLNSAPLDLNEIVGRVERLLNRVLGERIALSTLLHPEPLRLFADSGQLEQLLMNLAVNARDAMPGGGSLSISSAAFEVDAEFLRRTGFGALGRYARLSVSDTGAGLDEATRERIFEPFFTTQGVGGGSGLGLSIVYGIVEQHKGYIEVESAPGQGSVFRVYLPLLIPASRVPEPAPRQGGGGETVLLVEDNKEVRAIIGEILRGDGYRVLEAADSEEGGRSFARHSESIRLLLVDVVMPGRSGMELYREIKAYSPGMRVLFMSGYSEERIRASGVLASELAFISKPLAPAELLQRVRGVLDAETG